MGKPIPEEPILFMKPPSALLAPGRPIVRLAGYQRVDYEGELAVVIGRRLCKQPPERVAEHLCGYTALNDVTVRDLQKRDGQFTRAKGFDSFCPLGPAIATDFDLATLRLTTRKSGQQVQDSRGDTLIFSVYELVSFISQVMTLEPGDVVSTGTPSGVGNLLPGDRIEIEIAGIGTLTNPVVAGAAPPPLPARPGGS
jgi:2-keto-4-pentenoate hydratase/2-oxohepta-3-ene-1,7-dioic acid hydratase in catechol pathway